MSNRLPGASIPPETMMHFPPVSDFPPIFEQFSDSEETFHNFTFSRNFFDFHPPKFLMTFFSFFSHRPKISNFPPFFLFHNISPLFPENYYFFPYFSKLSPCFTQIHLLFTYFACIFLPTLTMMHLCITQCTYWTPLPFTIIHHIKDGIKLNKLTYHMLK